MKEASKNVQEVVFRYFRSLIARDLAVSSINSTNLVARTNSLIKATGTCDLVIIVITNAGYEGLAIEIAGDNTYGLGSEVARITLTELTTGWKLSEELVGKFLENLEMNIQVADTLPEK